MRTKGVCRRAFAAAFPHTIPIFAGFWFLGMAYGIYMNVSGFSFWYPMLMGLTIFGGSLEFVAVTMLLGTFAPLQTLVMALMIQARHLFYGIAMLEKFKGLGWKRFYLIFGLCDETFSINCSAEIPEDVDRGWFMFFVTALNHFYWVSGAAIGGLLGIALGCLLAMGVGSLIGAMLTSQMGGGATFSATPTLGAVAISFGVSVGIGVLFGYLPANKAAKLNPIDALRYD